MSMAGDGSSEAPWIVVTKEHLQAIGTGDYAMTHYYELANDIDLDGGQFTPIGGAAGSSYSAFQGDFDGKNYRIYNGYISEDTETYEYAGLFAVLIGASISNLRIEMDVTAWKVVGILAGEGFTGTSISNVHVSGAVIAGNEQVGGLVGRGRGNYTNCSSSATVSGSAYVGGFIGVYFDGGNITDCYATGDVENSNLGAGSYFAGFLGYATEVHVSMCYTTGNATGHTYTAGFIGRLDHTSATVIDCYSTGEVTTTGTVSASFIGRSTGLIKNGYTVGKVSASSLGGILNLKSGGNVVNSYWCTDSVGAVTDQGGTGRTLNEMQTLSTFTGVQESGTATGGSDTTLIHTGESWATNRWRSLTLKIVGGTGNGQERYIISNTADTLTVHEVWTTNPDVTSEYEIHCEWDIVAVANTRTKNADSDWNMVDRDDVETGQSYPFLSWEEVTIPAPILTATQENGNIRVSWTYPA
jgi:hypothetical protein